VHAQVKHVLLVAGVQHGTQASSNVYWLSQASVDDFAPGSSPQNMTAPPAGPAPIELACLSASPLRSRPGLLPYQASATPSTPS
jgi:hypothetical protein